MYTFNYNNYIAIVQEIKKVDEFNPNKNAPKLINFTYSTPDLVKRQGTVLFDEVIRKNGEWIYKYNNPKTFNLLMNITNENKRGVFHEED